MFTTPSHTRTHTHHPSGTTYYANSAFCAAIFLAVVLKMNVLDCGMATVKQLFSLSVNPGLLLTLLFYMMGALTALFLEASKENAFTYAGEDGWAVFVVSMTVSVVAVGVTTFFRRKKRKAGIWKDVNNTQRRTLAGTRDWRVSTFEPKSGASEPVPTSLKPQLESMAEGDEEEEEEEEDEEAAEEAAEEAEEAAEEAEAEEAEEADEEDEEEMEYIAEDEEEEEEELCLSTGTSMANVLEGSLKLRDTFNPLHGSPMASIKSNSMGSMNGSMSSNPMSMSSNPMSMSSISDMANLGTMAKSVNILEAGSDEEEEGTEEAKGGD